MGFWRPGLCHDGTCICAMKFPRLSLHLAEHCKGAGQELGGYGTLMLFPNVGIGILL